METNSLNDEARDEMFTSSRNPRSDLRGLKEIAAARTHRRRAGEQGFTLIEVSVVLMIISLLASITTATFTGSGTAPM